GGVEIIKGVASALHGGAALGGVINLTSRRPAAEPIRELLLNQTTLGGTDVVAFLASRAAEDGGLAWTMLGGAHTQRRVDRDHDGWTDLPGYDRLVLRPRAFWQSPSGHSSLRTVGFTGEEREGGTFPGATAPDGSPWPERLRTRRVDAGTVTRLLAGAGIVTVRASGSLQQHRHTFGPAVERDRHLTWFGEAAWTARLGAQDVVLGAAFQQERYDARDVSGFDYTFNVPSLFAQTTIEPTSRLALSASGRVDRHNEYGTMASPRLSLLLRAGETWSVRASAGAGYFAPTPFTEETEVTGLRPLRPLTGLEAERARSASIDVGGELGPFEVNGTLFASTVRDPVGVRPVVSDPQAIELVNVGRPTRTRGGELLLRWEREPAHVTATYTYVHATEADPATGMRRRVPLTPRHQAGIVTALEWEEQGRVGVEVYYTGRQVLHDDAFRSRSPSYVHVGVLVERRIGYARAFINGENLLGTRQTRHDPLVRPAPGLGGRWTNDVWGPLEGRVANVGVRLDLP
ncbi:MAG TPA: TonB-dependent receptor, partial [Gemmatimonadaceae bacterium]